MGYVSAKGEPNTQYELLRRRIYVNTKEIWFFVHSRLFDIQKKAIEYSPEIAESISYLLEMGQEHERSVFFVQKLL